MSRKGLRVAIAGCGLIGHKRAQALGDDDRVIATYDRVPAAALSLAETYGARHCATLSEALALEPDVVVVAVSHDGLAELSADALNAGADVLVEKPAAIGSDQIDQLLAAEARTGRRVKVGFNHRFHPGLMRAASEVHSGVHGELLHLRGRYGHGGRLGYEREWRADRQRSGGGELVDQGMHLLDLTYWIAGPLPLHSALLRTHFWDVQVEDNAALILGDVNVRQGPWASLHATWTEWKNMFSLEIYCRTAKVMVDGLVRSYGAQRLRIYRMSPQMGPPELEEVTFPDVDHSWAAEWEHFAMALTAADRRPLLGDLHSARYAWQQVEAAYASGPYAPGRDEPSLADGARK